MSLDTENVSLFVMMANCTFFESKETRFFCQVFEILILRYFEMYLHSSKNSRGVQILEILNVLAIRFNLHRIFTIRTSKTNTVKKATP